MLSENVLESVFAHHLSTRGAGHDMACLVEDDNDRALPRLI
jgi:hypothetical protein